MNENEKNTPELSGAQPDNGEKLSAAADLPNDSPCESGDSQAAAAGEGEGAEEQMDGELEKELDFIRESLQQELDALKENGGETASRIDGAEYELIQELDEISEHDADDADAHRSAGGRVCECCGEKPADSNFGEDYPYCADCRALMKANPINFAGILAFVLTIGVFVATVVLSRGYFDSYLTLMSGKQARAENRLSDAVSSYQEYLSGVGDSSGVSKTAVRDMVLSLGELGYYADATAIMQQYLSEKEQSSPELASITSDYEQLTATSTLINEQFSALTSGEGFDKQEMLEKINSVIEENEKEKTYNASYLQYVKYLVLLLSDSSSEECLEQLYEIERIDGGHLPWLYLTYIIDTAARLGDVDTAKEYFDKSIAINVQEMAVYVSYANAYRFCDEPDADKIIEIAQLAAQNCNTSDYPTYYKIYALGYLLKNDGEKAMTNMEQYMSSCQASVSDFNLYALCAAYSGDDEAYESASATLENYGYELARTVRRFKNGKLTLLEVLTDDGGDI